MLVLPFAAQKWPCHNVGVPAKTHGERIDRLEKVVEILAEDQVSLQKLIAELATETRRGFDQVAERFRETDARIDKLAHETDRRFQETAERFRETDERFRQMGERVDKLVLAIGKMIRIQLRPQV